MLQVVYSPIGGRKEEAILLGGLLSAPIESLLLRDLDTLDLHHAIVLPGRLPLVTSVPEVAGSGRGSVDPWLAVHAVLEPAVRAADGDVDDEVEILVEWSAVTACLAPWVDDPRAVGVRGREVGLVPERLVEVDVGDLQETGVDEGEEVLRSPLETVDVEALGIGRVKSLALDVVLPPCVVVGVRSPVECRRDNVVTTLRVGVVVTAGLHQVNLTRRRPWAVGVVDRHHPNGRPEPVTCGQLGLDLDAAVLDRSTSLRANATRLDRIDDSAVCGVSDSHTVRPEIRRTASVLEQVDDIVRLHQLRVLEGWLDLHHSVLNEDVLIRVGRPFELAVSGYLVSVVRFPWYLQFCLPIATNLNLLRPDLVVEAVGEVIIKDRAVVQVGDTLQTVVNEEASETETDENANDWNDRDPFLLRVFLLHPWSLELALLYSSRVKISLMGWLLDASARACGRSRHGAVWRGKRVAPGTRGWSRVDRVILKGSRARCAGSRSSGSAVEVIHIGLLRFLRRHTREE